MNKIGFIKTLWWSITKPSKYDEIIKMGLKKAIKYFITLIVLMALLLSIVGAYIQSIEVQKIANYFQVNVPEFKIENTAKEGEKPKYRLNLENNEAVILDDQNFINIYKHKVVVNTSIKEKEAIKEYYNLATDNNNCLLFLNDKCIIISSKYNPDNKNKEEGINKYTYSEVLNKIGPDFTEFSKTDLIGTLNNVSYIYYIISYFVNYFIVLLVLIAFDIVIIWVIGLIISKILKTNNNKRNIFSLSIYSCTLSIVLYIGYLIINYFAKFNVTISNFIIMFIAYVYMILYFYMNKKKDIA